MSRKFRRPVILFPKGRKLKKPRAGLGGRRHQRADLRVLDAGHPPQGKRHLAIGTLRPDHICGKLSVDTDVVDLAKNLL